MRPKQFVLLLCLLPFVTVFGQKAGDWFKYNGIEYRLETDKPHKEYNPDELQNDNLVACVTYIIDCTENIFIPNNVHYLGKSFVVTGIGDFAFRNCCESFSVRIPDFLKFIRCDDYDIGCSLFCESGTPEKLDISKATLTLGREILPYSSVTVSEDNSRYSAKDGVLFSKGMDTLFYYPTHKTDTLYNIPSGVKEIAPKAFAFCAYLKSVTIPATVSAIGDSAFYYCRELKHINLPKNLERIGQYAFFDCEITSVSIPNSLKSIGEGAFLNYYKELQEVKISKATPTLGVLSFGMNLQTISVSKNNKRYKVKDGVLFSKGQDTLFCYPIQKTDTLYNIPPGVKEIRPYAFINCVDLKSVTIPNSMHKIGNHAFSECYSLERIRFSSNIKSIDSAAFTFCRNLKHVDLPNTLEKIGAFSFSNCDLKSLFIPNSVRYLHTNSFWHLTNLEELIVTWDDPCDIVNIDLDLEDYYSGPFFQIVSGQTTLRVPKGTKERYESDQRWEGFKEIVEYDVK